MSLITQQPPPQLSPIPPDPDLLARLVAPGAFAPLRAPGILPPARQPDAAPLTPTPPLGPIGEVPGQIGAAPGPMAPPADLPPQPAAPHGLRGLLDRLNPIGASSPIAGLLKPQPKLPSDTPLPPAQDAQQQIIGARQQEQAIRPPQYSGKLGALEKVGDAAARLFAPGIESSLGIGTIGYQDRL